MSQIPVDVPASRIDSRSEKRLRFLLHFFDVFLFLFGAVEFFAVVAHVQEFAVDEGDLLVSETESLAIHKLFQNLQLLYNDGLLILGVDLLSVLTEDVIVQRVLATLLGSQIQDRATNLEQIFGYVFGFTAKLPSICVDEETFFLLLEEGAHLH